MSDLRVNNITNSNGDTGSVIAGVSTVASSAFMIMPSGNTEVRAGASGRGIFAGGYTPSSPNLSSTMNLIQISSTGNATDFGDTADAGSTGGTSNSLRGVFNYGDVPNSIVRMDYTILSSQGGVSNFGELSFVTRDGPFGSGDNTRGILGGSAGGPNNMGGSPGRGVNFIDYITFATTGESQRFGDLTAARRGVSSCSSPTRTVWGGGYIKPQNHTDTIDYVITQTFGNAIRFGELTVSRGHMGAVSSKVRGAWGGGSIYPGSSYNLYDTIDYVTLASIGQAIDFGNLASSKHFTTSTASNSTRGVWGGSNTDPSTLNTIEFITIATTGNATDFGDLTTLYYNGCGASDSHGGLG